MRKWINVDHPDNNVVKSHVPLNKILCTIRGRLAIHVLFMSSFLSSASLVCEAGGTLRDLSPCGTDKRGLHVVSSWSWFCMLFCCGIVAVSLFYGECGK